MLNSATKRAKATLGIRVFGTFTVTGILFSQNFAAHAQEVPRIVIMPGLRVSAHDAGQTECSDLEGKVGSEYLPGPCLAGDVFHTKEMKEAPSVS